MNSVIIMMVISTYSMHSHYSGRNTFLCFFANLIIWFSFLFASASFSALFDLLLLRF